MDPRWPMVLAALAGCTNAAEPEVRADVEAVAVTGEPGAYTFSVTLRSPDEGCAQYADWWEVVGADGELVYRRILRHSHGSEQPFTRSGGPVPVGADQVVVVRGYMNNREGYPGRALRGTVAAGFEAADLAPGFAVGAESLAPRPEGCLF